MTEENPYLELTAAFNRGRLRAVLSSGQAVVLHRLAVMSKDGDWILREDDEALGHVLTVLGERKARYRFGAPLDRRWLAGGWSAHLEHRLGRLRLRTDFVTRPPRLSRDELRDVWREAEGSEIPIVGLAPLAELKKTNREKDYAVIGELARRMPDPRSQILFSRSARDLNRLADRHALLVEELVEHRPLLLHIPDGRDALEQALDAERRTLMHRKEERLLAYRRAAQQWAETWPGVAEEIADRPLGEAHELIVARAETSLPWGEPSGQGGDAVIEMEDELLSEEDLDLRNSSWEELVTYWNLWLLQAQTTNDLDEASYSHGVFERDPAVDLPAASTLNVGRASGRE